MGIRRATSSSPYLISVMRVKISLLKSASGANEFISVLDRMSMELQSNCKDRIGLHSCTCLQGQLS
eukprot:162890-Pelagomonas_calceolata.AAC.1